jgi:thiol:disulfide interchange protein
VGRRILAWVAAVALAVGGWWFSFERAYGVDEMVQEVIASKFCPCFDEMPQLTMDAWNQKVPWQPWAKGRPEYLAANGYTVYVDYTATWCATCQVNKAATVESQRVREQMRDQCVIPLKADFTLEDPDILAELQKFGRSGVPLNVIFPAGKPGEPIVLPEQLVGRIELVADKLAEAGPTMECARESLATEAQTVIPALQSARVGVPALP